MSSDDFRWRMRYVSERSNISSALWKRNSSDESSEYLISAVVIIIFLIHLSVLFATLLFKWLNGPSPVFLLDPLKQNYENCYVVAFITGCRSDKSMRGTVIFSLQGTQANTDDYEVSAQPGNELEAVFSKCSHDFFHINPGVVIGNLIGVSVNLVSQEKFAKWGLSYVTVHVLSDSSFHYFPVSQCLTAVSGYSESVMAGKQTKYLQLLLHNIRASTLETFLWLSRFTTKHTDKFLDVLSNIFLCYFLISCLMLLLLFYVRIDQGNTVLFSASHVVAMLAAVLIATSLTTILQLSYRHFSIASSSILQNFTPVDVKKTLGKNQNNASEFRQMVSTPTMVASWLELEDVNRSRSSNNSNNLCKNTKFVARIVFRENMRYRRKRLLMERKTNKTVSLERLFRLHGNSVWKRMNLMRKKKVHSRCRHSFPFVGKQISNQFETLPHTTGQIVSSVVKIVDEGNHVAASTDQSDVERPITSINRSLEMFAYQCLIRFDDNETLPNVIFKTPMSKIHSSEDFFSRILGDVWQNCLQTSALRDECCQSEEANFLANFLPRLRRCRVKAKDVLEMGKLDEDLMKQSDILSIYLRTQLPERNLNPIISEKSGSQFGALTHFLVCSLSEILSRQADECCRGIKAAILSETETAFFQLMIILKIRRDSSKKFFHLDSHVSPPQANNVSCFNFLQELFSSTDRNTRDLMLNRIKIENIGSELWKRFLHGHENETQLQAKEMSDHLSTRLMVLALDLIEDTDEDDFKIIFVHILRNASLFLRRFLKVNKLASLFTKYALTTFACSQLTSFMHLCSFKKNYQMKKCQLCSGQREIGCNFNRTFGRFISHSSSRENSMTCGTNVVCLLSHAVNKLDKTRFCHGRLSCRKCREKSLRFALHSSMRRCSMLITERILWQEVQKSMKTVEEKLSVLLEDFLRALTGTCSEDVQPTTEDVELLFHQRFTSDVKVFREKLVNQAETNLSNLLLRIGRCNRAEVHEVLMLLQSENSNLLKGVDNIFTGEMQVLGKWFVAGNVEGNRCNHNKLISNHELVRPGRIKGFKKRSNASSPPIMTRQPSPSTDSPANDPSPSLELRHLEVNSANYSSMTSPTNQNAAIAEGGNLKTGSSFEMSELARNIRWKYFRENLWKNVPQSLKRIFMLCGILLSILLCNLVVLLCGDKHAHKEAANIWVISLFTSCVYQFCIFEPLKILTIAIVWTFKRGELFQ